MKVVCSRDELTRGLARVVPAAATKNTMPILSHVLIRGRGKNLQLLATDLQVGIQYEIGAEVVDGGGVTVPARKIFDICRELPADDVTLSLDDGGRLTVTSGKFSCRIVAMPEDEFPSLPTVEEEQAIELDPALFNAIAHRTSFAVSQDETRMTLTGVYLHAEKGKSELEVVATDSHRLAMETHKLGKEAPLTLSAIVPKKAMDEVARLASDCGEEEKILVVPGQTHTKFSVGGVTVLARLIEGKFPDYNQVIPKEVQRSVVMNRAEFTAANHRIQHMAADRSSSVRYELAPQKVTLRASTADVGEASDEVSGNLDGTGLTVAYNSRYVLEGLKVLKGEEITLGITDAVGPSTLASPEDPSYLYVVMPMRI